MPLADNTWPQALEAKDMTGFMVAGIFTVLTVLLMMARSNIRRWLGYANVADISFTVIMIYLFHDTFSGIVSAAFAGVFMSLMLTILKKTLGYERLQAVRTKWYKGFMRLHWVRYPPRYRMAI